MQKNEILKKGIVLRISEFKEADAMVNAIGEDGFFSFFARGIRKISSKNAPATQPFSYSEFTLFESASSALSLKEASPLCFYSPKEESLVSSFFLSFLQEVSLKVVQEDEASACYPFLKGTLDLFKEGQDPLVLGLLYFAKVLSIGGYGLEVGECVRCHGKKSIVSLSYEEGGFLCADCFDPEIDPKTPVRHLQIARFLFRCGLEDFPRAKWNEEESLIFYQNLGDYFENQTGMRLKSLSLLKAL